MTAFWNDEAKLKQEARKFSATDTLDVNYTQYVILAIFQKLRTILVNFLASKEFMQVRNSLVFLNSIIHIFPPIEEDANLLLPFVEDLQKDFTDKEDLRKFAESYKNSLKKKILDLPKTNRKRLREKAGSRKGKGPTGTPNAAPSKETSSKEISNPKSGDTKYQTKQSSNQMQIEEIKEPTPKIKTEVKREESTKKKMDVEAGNGGSNAGKRSRDQLNASDNVNVQNSSASSNPNKKQQEPKLSENDTESLNTRPLKKVHREETKDGETDRSGIDRTGKAQKSRDDNQKTTKEENIKREEKGELNSKVNQNYSSNSRSNKL